MKTNERAVRRLPRVPEAKRQQVWELHLQAWPAIRIGRELDLTPKTVGRIIRDCRAAVRHDREQDLREKLEAAIARMRHIQRRAWQDHEEDDRREQEVLAGGHSERGQVVRFQSQRAQYLRVILDAEREIARLEGLHDMSAQESGAVVFRIERIVERATAAVAPGSSLGAVIDTAALGEAAGEAAGEGGGEGGGEAVDATEGRSDGGEAGA